MFKLLMLNQNLQKFLKKGKYLKVKGEKNNYVTLIFNNFS